MVTKKAASNYKYKTLQDLAGILRIFNTFRVEEWSVTEISRSLNMPPSKVSRMIRTWEDEAFFEKNPENGKYRLGIGFLELGVVNTSNLPLRKIVRPHLEQMAKETKLAVACAILRNSKVVVIDSVKNLNIDLFTYRMTLNIPIHSSSIGKLLLAYLPREELDQILKSNTLKTFTNATVADLKSIRQNLELIREKGYATDEQETHPDLNSIAAPIRNGSGQVIAALNLMDEKSTTSAEKLFQFADYLKEKALFISRQLGYSSSNLSERSVYIKK